MVLFRREFSFSDSLYLWEVSFQFSHLQCFGLLVFANWRVQQMMWALEYDPDQFATYEDCDIGCERTDMPKGKAKSKKQCGKFERENLRNGAAAPLPISVFLVASVLKDKSSKLQAEARGLDEVVKVSSNQKLVQFSVASL